VGENQEAGQALIESADVVVVEPIRVFKSEAKEEGGERIVYCVAANEAFDSEDEKILKSLLLKSAPYFQRFGNIDIDHMSVLAYRAGFRNPRQFEIGRPREVRDSPEGVLVKGVIYRGHELADEFWRTVTEVQPPMDWWASVYVRPDAEGGRRRVWSRLEGKHKSVITAGEWGGLGFAREPVNRSLRTVQTMPFGAFLKATTAALALPCCEDCADGATVCKATTATVDGAYVSDPAALRGGAALRGPSGEPRLAKTVPGAAGRYLAALHQGGTCDHTRLQGTPTFRSIVAHFTECEGMAADDAQRAARALLARIAPLATEGATRRAA